MKVDIERIRAGASGAEAAGFLLADQQALIHQQGWLKMLAPRAAGGAEMPLPQVVRLEEAIAEADGSMGWVVTLCAGAGWFAGFLPPESAREIIATPNVCLAGSGAPTGFADTEGDGYRITGRWDIASGAPMATHFTLNAVLRGERPSAEPDRMVDRRSRLSWCRPAQVVIEPTWRSFGMKGSASHSYRIDGAWVPASHGFTVDPAHATARGTLYRFPFMLLAWVTLAANLSGMARHFLALAQDIVAVRRQPPASAQDALARAALALQGARERMVALLDPGLGPGRKGRMAASRRRLTRNCAKLRWRWCWRARRAVGDIYPYCGLRAAQEDSEINRVWRDFHTASQHALFTP
ncbi:acyl-CoA dehydrogenase [Massilia eburnea]|uniref:acyl-CoA dehydrogenase n=1 Tax=Massilia eburnea TaxID=1776165 RepID=UPI003D6A053A